MRSHHLARLVSIAIGLLFAIPAQAGILNGLYSRDAIDVIAVGDNGAIYRSVNGGINWAITSQGTTPLRAVAGNGLTLILVGDGGKILRSTDSGGTWSLYTAPGSPTLLDVAMPSASNVFVAGAGGTLLRSTDGGVTWTALSSGTANALNCVRFQDATHGWIAGNGGYSARTSNAGDNWSASGPSTVNNLLSVDQNGSRIWVVGAKSTCWKSTNDGANWTAVDLHIDSRTDVRSVTLQSADSVFIAGGGGYIRRSVNDGTSWTFLQHQIMGEIGDMFWVGATGFVCSIRSPSVIRTNDRGNTWLNSVSTTITRNWVQKIPLGTGDMRGNAMALNGTYRNEIYAAVGNKFYISRDDGETWTQFSTLPSGYNRVNAYVVNPKDSMVMVCAVNPPNAILYTNDGGATWSNKLSHAFGEYGIPLEMHPDKTDTLFFGGDSDVLWRSTDFGKSWASYGVTSFRSPCDLIVVPESDSNAVLVGDGITGSGVGDLWRSTDGGVHFTKNYTVPGSEIPGMSMGRLRNNTAFATNWSSGGVERTQNTGLAWTQVQTTASGWGTDVCKEDPNVVVYGVYSGGVVYLSLDGGTTFSGSSILGSNYSFLARDRNCIIAQMSSGLWKLSSVYSLSSNATQTVNVTAANGFEVWTGGSVHNITWTSANVVLAKIEYQKNPSSPWQLVANVPGYYGTYAWTVPYDATTQARIRVSDAWDSTPTDISDNDFTIATPMIANQTGDLSFGGHPVGSSTPDSITISNPGTATLHVTSIVSSNPAFFYSPFNLTIAPGSQTQLYVTFQPTQVQAYNDSLTLTSDAGNSPSFVVHTTGVGADTASITIVTPDGGEVYAYGTSQKVEWLTNLVDFVDISYRTSPKLAWVPIVTHIPAAAHSYGWSIPDAPTTTGRLLVQESGGSRQDISATDFSIVVPHLDTSPSTEMDFDKTIVGTPVDDSLRLTNPGTGTLHVSMISSTRPTFVPHRTSVTLLPGASDTVGFTFTPTATGYDTATITITADDPSNPHSIRAVGVGSSQVSAGGPLPTQFALMQNQPNPFRATTLIRYALPRESDVTLELFNLQGQRVSTLVRTRQPAGNYTIEFDPSRDGRGGPASAGVYFYRFRAGEFSATKKMLFMR